jgi:hypothetical protein
MGSALTACRERAVVEPRPSSAHPASNTLRADGLSFVYPGEWLRFDVQEPASPQPPSGTAQYVVGIDDLNNVTLVSSPVPSAGAGASIWSDQVKSQFAGAFESQGMRVQSGPEEVMVAGERGLRWRVWMPSGMGYILESTLAVVFRGNTEYFVRCQHTLARTEEMDHGCEEVLLSLQLG